MIRRLLRAYLRRRRMERLKSERMALLAAQNAEFRPRFRVTYDVDYDSSAWVKVTCLLLENGLGARRADVFVAQSNERLQHNYRSDATYCREVAPWIAGADVAGEGFEEVAPRSRAIPDHWPVDQVAINLALTRVFGPDESKWPARERAQALLGVP